MRKCAKYGLVTLLMFCFATSVKAEECSYEKQVELSNKAATVKATYESVDIKTGEKLILEDTEEEVDDVVKGFKVKILNITEDLMVTITDNQSNTSKSYYYSDTDKGTLTLQEQEANIVRSYTVEIKGFYEGCEGTDLRTVALIVPKYNSYSTLAICDEYPEFEYCQEYLTSGNDISVTEFLTRIDKYQESHKSETEKKENKKQSFIDKVKEFFKKNKKAIVIVAIAVVIVGVATATILIVRRRSRLI